jgi:hypothetical protein
MVVLPNLCSMVTGNAAPDESCAVTGMITRMEISQSATQANDRLFISENPYDVQRTEPESTARLMLRYLSIGLMLPEITARRLRRSLR